MAEITSIPPFDPFEQTGSVGPRWDRWKTRLQYYIDARGITVDNRKRALLLHLAGPAVQDIFATLSDTGTSYMDALTALNTYFTPQKSLQFERHTFRQAHQAPNESISQYVTRLRRLGEHCDFDKYSLDEAIKDQLIEHCHSNTLRRRLLREKSTVSLSSLIDIARSMESANFQAANIENASSQENSEFAHQLTTPILSEEEQVNFTSDNRQQCTHCGNQPDHQPRTPKCPAFRKTCSQCGTLHHFGRVCMKRTTNPGYPKGKQAGTPKARYVCYSSDEDESHQAFHLNPTKEKSDITVTIEGTPVKVCIDSGATANTIDYATYEAISAGKTVPIKPTNVKLCPYGEDNPAPIPLVGSFFGLINTPSGQTDLTKFLVLKARNAGCLLSRETSTRLGMLHIAASTATEHPPLHGEYQYLLQKFPAVFSGKIGKLKDYQLELNIDPTVQPVVQNSRPTPLHYRPKVEAKLKQLEEQDIIEHVTGPTPWVSPLVIVDKPNGDVRLCVNMCKPNEALCRTHHPYPTSEEILQDLNGSQFFSKIDLKECYHQIELTESSRHLTTFKTHAGLRRYKRLPYGASVGSEVCQHVIGQVLEGCHNARNIADDILVHGTTREEHDRSLENVLLRLQDKNLTVNPAKCLFGVTELDYYGFHISAQGISPDKNRIHAIKQMQPPSTATEARSFLGLVNTVARFVPNLAAMTEPIRRITHKNHPWLWGPEQSEAFNKLRDLISSNTVLAHFDPSLPTQVRHDACKIGISGALTQKHPDGSIRPVAYASRSLSPVEQRYSQTEREALSGVWACERFHFYIHGSQFDLVGDHKPLEVLLNGRGNPSPRIERWRLRLQNYSPRIVYQPGIQNAVDFLSRKPVPTNTPRDPVEEYVNSIIVDSLPSAVTLQELLLASECDPTLNTIKEALDTGNWSAAPKPFADLKDELCQKRGIILRNNRIVIPDALRPRIIQLAHEGHQGITKVKQHLRQRVWWPGIDIQAERYVRDCLGCQIVGPTPPPEPLRMTDPPKQVWHTVHVDYCGPFPSGEYLFVAVDETSKYPEVHVTRSSTAATAITHLTQMFATHGIPEVITSDNVPFGSEEFAAWCKQLGIRHRKITPLWPAANAQVERFNKTLEKTIRIALVEGKNWRSELFVFLMNYRNTPHSSTGVSPASLLMNRHIRTKIPCLDLSRPSKLIKTARSNDNLRKSKAKSYMDKRHRATPSDIRQGDQVLLLQKRQNKLTTRYDPRPFTVVRKKGVSVELARGGARLFRNVSMVKKVIPTTRNIEPVRRPPQEVSLPSHGNITVENAEHCSRPFRERRVPSYLNDFHLS